jgi:hypothetical protein
MDSEQSSHSLITLYSKRLFNSFLQNWVKYLLVAQGPNLDPVHPVVSRQMFNSSLSSSSSSLFFLKEKNKSKQVSPDCDISFAGHKFSYLD